MSSTILAIASHCYAFCILGALAFGTFSIPGEGLTVPSQNLMRFNESVDDSPSGNPYLVRLRREVFPVKRNGKVVSFKASYSGVIHVGNPVPQEFRVVFDTGSGHVILPSVECRTSTCLKHRRYNMQRSSTAVAVNLDGTTVHESMHLGDQVTIGFGTGKIVGEFVRDDVCLGPAPAPQAFGFGGPKGGPCVNTQAVMAIDMSRRPFDLFDFDGIMGLGLSSLALSANFSFFGLLASSGQIGQAHFGVFLADTDFGEESEIALGGHNPSRLLEPLAWVPMVKPELGYWQVEIMAVHIDGRKLDICSNVPCSGILDTGTSHLGIPAGFDGEVGELLTREAGEVTDCRQAEAPVVRIELRDFNLTLFPENYMRKLPLAEDVNIEAHLGVSSTSYQDNETDDGGAEGSALAGQAAGGLAPHGVAPREPKHYCTPKLLPVNLSATIGGNVFILGEPVLHRYYTVYDWGGLRAGFGLAAHHGSSVGKPRVLEHLRRTKEQRRAQVEDDDLVVLLQVHILVRPRSRARRIV